MKQLFTRPLKVLIEYIKISLDIIVAFKVEEELKKYHKDNKNAASDYETLLQKEEESIRQHISTEHQLKIQCEKYAEKLDKIEFEKNQLMNDMVSIFIIIVLNCRNMKEKNMTSNLTNYQDKLIILSKKEIISKNWKKITKFN